MPSTLQTEASWLTEREKRREESLREIEGDFRFLLPACPSLPSNWEKSRELAIFPVTNLSLPELTIRANFSRVDIIALRAAMHGLPAVAGRERSSSCGH